MFAIDRSIEREREGGRGGDNALHKEKRNNKNNKTKTRGV
jgi:hypothetical protein